MRETIIKALGEVDLYNYSATTRRTVRRNLMRALGALCAEGRLNIFAGVAIAPDTDSPIPYAPTPLDLAVTETEKEIAISAFGKIPAIRMYRERTGLGLHDAKEVIERAIAAHTAAAPEVPSCIVTEHEATLARTNLIAAIKAYRERTGRCLRDSKNAIEAAREATKNDSVL